MRPHDKHPKRPSQPHALTVCPDAFAQPADSRLRLFGFCTQTFVADVQPVLQYSDSSVNAVDGIYWRLKGLFSVRVIFLMRKQLLK